MRAKSYRNQEHEVYDDMCHSCKLVTTQAQEKIRQKQAKTRVATM